MKIPSIVLPIGFIGITVAPVLAAPDSVNPPRDLKLPLVVWAVDFNDDPVGLPPQAAVKVEAESLLGRSAWEALPMRKYSALSYVTRTRTATVETSALGLEDKPILFSFTENRQPTYGPQLSLRVPSAIASRAARWKLSLDVAKGNVGIVGGINLGDLGAVLFHEDGTVRANKVEVSRYLPNVPIHLDILIDVRTKQFSVSTGAPGVTGTNIPWRTVGARQFSAIRLDGLIPGGHAQVPGKIAFDNIRLELLEVQ